ncbi:1-deoxy-D-xylulose-5-phosphate reductoisomerase [Bulleidia sp. zg-1006]|uniref:1-deoxy-D-xylulose-5-phosphate reductoisomerase n=1 Tax=Bulleidia sp. zg-1006 TaxID=2806552 RepID=UPI001939D92E|nr:1-deoxy-D-xylulose-5-phosphate reductoisomerase [Bulleidia sp. zg-1006]QRG87152.1 1-deoxy-D-xylulose-5-phosphate reductoisomerase [Bulleidia sp. zg-1006]
MKRLVLLGASGSIGEQTLDVLEQHPSEFELVALSVGHRLDCFKKAILNHPELKAICVQEEKDALSLKKDYPHLEVVFGDYGLKTLSEMDYDVLVNALVGFVGFYPSVYALESGHDVALANKESLVVGGEVIQTILEETGRKLFPIDSEHSAIFQCLQGEDKKGVENLWITASGGSFRHLRRDELENVTVKQALSHPNWTMGAKITIDSATMMNKGFEVIEAHYLFGIPYHHIKVVLHPESIIHSMVEFKDHSFMAQLASPDMRLPIQYALSYPNRWDLEEEHPFNPFPATNLSFQKLDFMRFPLLKLAYEAGLKKGNQPILINAANEVANLAFREGNLSFLDIENCIQDCLNHFPFETVSTKEDVLRIHQEATSYCQKIWRK